MKRNCSNCPHSTFGGGYDPSSDVCDSCTCDPDTGWGGFTDHSISDDDGNPIHFDSDDERQEFYILHQFEDWF